LQLTAKIFIMKKKTAEDFNCIVKFKSMKVNMHQNFYVTYFLQHENYLLRYNLLNSFNINARMIELRKFISGQLINMGKRNT